MLVLSNIKWPWAYVKRETDSSAVVGWVYLLICIIAGATHNVFAKALSGSLPPLTLMFFSELLMLFFTLLFFGVVPTLKHLRKADKRTWIPMLFIGLTNGIVGPFLLFTGLQYTTAVNAALFSNAEMVFIILFAVMFLGERWTKIHTICITSIVIGILIISLRGFSESFALRAGDIILLLASLSFGTGSCIFRKYLHHADPRLVLFVRSFLPVSLFFLLSPFTNVSLVTEIGWLPLALIPALLGFGFLSRFLNTFTFYKAVEHLPITTISLASNMTLIVSVLFANAILHEPVMTYHWIGGIFILIGTLFMELTGSHVPETHMESHLTEKKTSRM